MRRKAIWLSLIVLSSLSLAAGLAKAKDAAPSNVAWKDLKAGTDDKARREFMKKVVMPKMKPIFQKFDPKKFKEFTCQTCHGEDAAELKYKMPTPGIHPLPSTPEAFKAKVQATPGWQKWTEFMAGQVEPVMAELLGRTPFNPEKPAKDAFSCAGCHKLE